MRKIYFILVVMMLGCIGCDWQLRLDETEVTVDRYDRIQSLYLTTSDFSALQQMKTDYPMQTRTLIEDVLRIGKVNDPQINAKFLHFYQNSTLQMLISEAEVQYANMEDINDELNKAFQFLKKELSNMEVPQVYSQIGSLAQSIIVGNGMIGICLDKYLGMDYELYLRPEYGYSLDQRRMMQRHYIVPDCIGFYLLSIYPLPVEPVSQAERDVHMGRIQWVVNQAIGHEFFDNMYVQKVERFMSRNKNIKIEQLLSTSKYSDFL
ncbi:MAG: gliding motility protein GldB [Prevotella sp.]|nr:gliding motility protein GldB [Prevotella sp.]